MASFQAKTGWERPRKSENKNYCSDQFLPDPLKRIPKKQQKIKKTPLWLLFKPKQVGKHQERVKIKIIVLINSYSTHDKEFQKNSKIIQKIKKHDYGFFSCQNRLGKPKKG